jgi:glycine/D-amino acid oxidase-like deaminating enzyme/nitrite reductase/ring-hydroxylating ferredoxin subunit
MSNLSYWLQTTEKQEYEKLEKDLETDVLIIGGGISGVSCAYCLACRGAKPVLIEAGEIAGGTTGHSTGKVTVQHDIIYSNLIEKYSMNVAAGYFASQAQALRFVKDAVKRERIECQLGESTAWMYAMAENEVELLKREYEAAKKLNIPCEWAEKPGFPDGALGALGYHKQAVFHPARYVLGLARAAEREGAKIYSYTKAVRVENDEPIEVTLENGAVIRARHVVMATQYPIFDGPNVFFTRLYAQRDYGIAVIPQRDWPEGSYINLGEPTRSIRTHLENKQKILIVVGETHATGREEDKSDLHYENLEGFAKGIAGIKEILAHWSAQDYETPDQIPYIGRLSDNSNLYVAAGFGKWGLTSGTLSGMMIADLITKGNCEYESVYSRKRADYMKSMGKAASEVLASVGELVKSKFEAKQGIEGLEKGEGRSIRFEGKPAGIYRDGEDQVTIVEIACTHMSTTLNFNPAEKTWDCPAHGGRFSIDGKLLEGPPKNDLPVLFRGSWQEFVRRMDGGRDATMNVDGEEKSGGAAKRQRPFV